MLLCTHNINRFQDKSGQPHSNHLHPQHLHPSFLTHSHQSTGISGAFPLSSFLNLHQYTLLNPVTIILTFNMSQSPQSILVVTSRIQHKLTRCSLLHQLSHISSKIKCHIQGQHLSGRRSVDARHCTVLLDGSQQGSNVCYRPDDKLQQKNMTGKCTVYLCFPLCPAFRAQMIKEINKTNSTNIQLTLLKTTITFSTTAKI